MKNNIIIISAILVLFCGVTWLSIEIDKEEKDTSSVIVKEYYKEWISTSTQEEFSVYFYNKLQK